MHASRRNETNLNLNLVILGHRNAGKATIAGKALQQAKGNKVSDRISEYLFNNLGRIKNEIVHSTEHISANEDENSTKRARVLNDLQAEKERQCNDGRTSRIQFGTLRHTLMVVDVPGHCNFMKNMITGTSTADCGPVVVAADAFEAETIQYEEVSGQVHLANSLGIRQLIFLLTKMDTVEWNEVRYQQIRSLIGALLADTRYSNADIACIPTCGFGGDNLISESAYTPWYTRETNKSRTKGLSLCEAIDGLASSRFTSERPLRLPIRDVYKLAGIGIVPVGRVESGVLRAGMNLRFASSPRSVRVKALEMPKWPEAGIGNTVGFSIVGLPPQEICRGDVAGDAYDDTAPCKIRAFRAQIVVLGQTSLQTGSTVILDCHTVRTNCKVSQVEVKVDRRTGRHMETNPDSLKYGDVGIVSLITNEPVCVELFADFPTLGRFIMHDLEARIAVGIITFVDRPKACA